MAESCLLCSKKKATRLCPVYNSLICSQCCGTKRRRTISCPDNCSYLIAGRTYAARRLAVVQAQTKFQEQFAEVIRTIEKALVEIRRLRFRDLIDSEVKEGLDLVIKTNETLAKGIIYEYKTVDPKIQSIIDAVQEMVNRHIDGKTKPTIDRKEAILCLRFIFDSVKLQLKPGKGKTSYLDFISQYV